MGGILPADLVNSLVLFLYNQDVALAKDQDKLPHAKSVSGTLGSTWLNVLPSPPMRECAARSQIYIFHH